MIATGGGTAVVRQLDYEQWELALLLGAPGDLRDHQPAPGDGWRWAWRVDDGSTGSSLPWRAVTSPKRCRYTVGPGHRLCGAPAIAELLRGTRRPSWWGYCEDHLYGRKFLDGRVWHVVSERVP